jgi:hypothetical protein
MFEMPGCAALVDNMTFMPGGNSDLMFFRCPAYLPVVWLQKEEVSVHHQPC